MLKRNQIGAVFISGLSVSLSACGGGGGVASTPTPTAPQYSTLTNFSGTYAVLGTRITIGRPAGAPVPTVTSATPAITFSYDAASKTYQISSDVPGQISNNSYGPSQLATGSSDEYETQLNLDLTRLNVGRVVNLTYTNIGMWRKVSTNIGGDNTQSDFYFAYGVPTQVGDMPRTGNATYALTLSGSISSGFVGGTGSMAADFASGTTSFSLSPNYVQTRVEPPFATLTGTGTIDSANAAFAGTVAGNGYTGVLKGLFFGPQAAEVGGNFFFTDPNGNFGGAGAFVGGKK